MTCTQFSEETLSDYQDGALPVLTRWSIARHVKTCPDCARRLAELTELADTARARFSTVELPGSLLPEVKKMLLHPIAEKEVQKMIRRFRIQTAFTTAGALAAVGGIGFAVLTPLLHPMPALADVAQEMKKVSTIQWDEVTEQTRNQPETWSESFQRNRQHWAANLTDGAIRIDSSPESYSVSSPTEGVLTVNGKYARRDKKTHTVLPHVIQILTTPELHAHFHQQMPEGVKHSEEVIDGVRRIRIDAQAPFLESNHKLSIWIDPQIKLPIRTREEYTDTHNLNVVTIRENFRYNEPIPAERFSAKLPEGTNLAD
ncbi:MAG: zf-HC2 domain-containing protein [Armatimonas sp.]